MAVLDDVHRIERSLLDHPDGLRHADLAQATGIPASTLSTQLAALRGWGRVEESGDGAWRISTRWLAAHMNASLERLKELDRHAQNEPAVPA